METEQWKLGGDCKKCRRKSYCTKMCSAWKKKKDKLLHDAVKRSMNVNINGKYDFVK